MNDGAESGRAQTQAEREEEEEEVVEVMARPPQIPDLNIMACVKRQKDVRMSPSTEDLCLLLQDGTTYQPSSFINTVLYKYIPAQLPTVRMNTMLPLSHEAM